MVVGGGGPEGGRNFEQVEMALSFKSFSKIHAPFMTAIVSDILKPTEMQNLRKPARNKSLPVVRGVSLLASLAACVGFPLAAAFPLQCPQCH